MTDSIPMGTTKYGRAIVFMNDNFMVQDDKGWHIATRNEMKCVDDYIDTVIAETP